MTPQRSAKLHFLTPAKAANKGDIMKIKTTQLKAKLQTLAADHQNDARNLVRELNILGNSFGLTYSQINLVASGMTKAKSLLRLREIADSCEQTVNRVERKSM